ncbi:MAG: pyrroline-5-carboxylate reductase [Elusimicrobia bacterium RIFCSPLOWO2_01_FULL_60_11]|nr:MAG: pyrroline-5-carboxylate reductase [Elusimicrobia bacterium RIFCSPLOWO2_01_FULL_60_11]
MKIAFLGAGNMGSALVLGALKAKVLKAGQVTAFDVSADALKALKRKSGVKTAGESSQAAVGADYIFLCVKPQQMAGLLSELKGRISSKQCLVSIAAGVTTGRIEAAFSPSSVAVVRVMPNTPAMVGEGASAVCGGRHAKPAQVKFALKFFSSVGKAVELPESAFDAVTAVSGSGPAYIFYLAESLIEAAQAGGLSSEAAQVLARQTILGAAMMLGGKESPQDLRRKVTSPGGTTEAALRHLEAGRWKEIFVEAVRKAKERSEELGKL